MLFFFFFNNPATPEIYPLPLHAPLPIWAVATSAAARRSSAGTITSRSARLSTATPTASAADPTRSRTSSGTASRARSEEHTSELQSRQYLVCRLLLEKKKQTLLLPPFHR